MAEGELFVEGQTPDFSVLQELLCPPCLESEPCSSSSSSNNALLCKPRVVGPETASIRESRFDPIIGMACCLQIPESQALSFLQETTQFLSQSGPTSTTTAIYGPMVPHGYGACFPEGAQTSFGSLDTLSLISLHCSSLETEPGVGMPMQEWNPIACAKEYGGHHLWATCLEEPQTAQPLGISVPHISESPREGTRRVSRKQSNPQRSCEPLDSAFQGVTFQMHLHLCPGSSEGCRLLICPRYSSGKLRKRRVPLAKEEGRTGSSEEEEGCLSTHRYKRCASCKTRKTPLWRDAEDGTPLCNACGIRYKKYRIRCFRCWNIPKHGGKPYSHCSNCGGRLRVVAAQPKCGKRCATF
ncbi:GATA-type zinc finger protein 1 [Sceloporus undulatus]|uniref:GATA-type zinc finger protein 1 n=1 Tax=Sceloporus undulatus TaxID=8520 RepID=UPI001C4BAA86|nr:GATA-type zinc finger protein 1 [Sceloporus undulatus]